MVADQSHRQQKRANARPQFEDVCGEANGEAFGQKQTGNHEVKCPADELAPLVPVQVLHPLP